MMTCKQASQFYPLWKTQRMLYIQMYSCKTDAIGHDWLVSLMQKLGFRANILHYCYFWGLQTESDTKRNHRCNQQHLKAFRTVSEKQTHEWNDKLELSAPGPRSWVTAGFSRTRRQPAFKMWARTSEPEVVNITWFKISALVRVSLQ